ncbi:MAG: hypothetical protein R6V29_14850 [Spirochaetia bacterium]
MKCKVEILGLLGFTVSGCLFVLSALRTGDVMALGGSLVWIMSCLGWIAAIIVQCRKRDSPPEEALTAEMTAEVTAQTQPE